MVKHRTFLDMLKRTTSTPAMNLNGQSATAHAGDWHSWRKLLLFHSRNFWLLSFSSLKSIHFFTALPSTDNCASIRHPRLKYRVENENLETEQQLVLVPAFSKAFYFLLVCAVRVYIVPWIINHLHGKWNVQSCRIVEREPKVVETHSKLDATRNKFPNKLRKN